MSGRIHHRKQVILQQVNWKQTLYFQIKMNVLKAQITVMAKHCAPILTGPILAHADQVIREMEVSHVMVKLTFMMLRLVVRLVSSRYMLERRIWGPGAHKAFSYIEQPKTGLFGKTNHLGIIKTNNIIGKWKVLHLRYSRGILGTVIKIITLQKIYSNLA